MIRSLAALLIGASVAAAQTQCPNGVLVPDLGYEFLSCHDCLKLGQHQGVTVPLFTGTPALFRIRANGPGAGKLMDGDTLLTVNGLGIATVDGGVALSTWKPEIILGVRRAGNTVTVKINPLGQCLPAGSSLMPQSDSLIRKLGLKSLTWKVASDSLRVGFKKPPLLARNGFIAKPLPANLAFKVVGAYDLGLDLDCTTCITRKFSTGETRWIFPRYPVVKGVEPGSFSARLGLRSGDTLLSVNGRSLLTAEGARLLAGIRPPSEVTLAWRRDGSTISATGRATAGDTTNHVTETVGATTVDVRGKKVTTTRDPRTGALQVMGDSLVVTITPVRPDTTRLRIPKRF